MIFGMSALLPYVFLTAFVEILNALNGIDIPEHCIHNDSQRSGSERKICV